MIKQRSPLNPSSLSDALTKDWYAQKAAKRKNLQRERQERVDWLRKKAKGNEAAQVMADKLEACRPNHRCKSAACPECADVAQRLFAKITRRYLRGKSGVVCVTIVPVDSTVAPGSLSVGDQERFARRTKDKLGRAYDGVFIGGIDWSFNEHKQQKHLPHWCSHIHGITVTNDAQALKKKLKKAFPPSNAIPRPVKVQEWDGELAALRYAFKPEFERRISTNNGKRFYKKTGENRKCRDTDSQPLKSKDRLELLLHLDTIGIAGRLFLKNVQFMNLKDTGPTFVARQSKARVRENDEKG